MGSMNHHDSIIQMLSKNICNFLGRCSILLSIKKKGKVHAKDKKNNSRFLKGKEQEKGRKVQKWAEI